MHRKGKGAERKHSLKSDVCVLGRSGVVGGVISNEQVNRVDVVIVSRWFRKGVGGKVGGSYHLVTVVENVY